jgi:hypothetical protein
MGAETISEITKKRNFILQIDFINGSLIGYYLSKVKPFTDESQYFKY